MCDLKEQVLTEMKVVGIEAFVSAVRIWGKEAGIPDVYPPFEKRYVDHAIETKESELVIFI